MQHITELLLTSLVIIAVYEVLKKIYQKESIAPPRATGNGTDNLNSTWSSWSSWSQCSVTCREGVQIRTRTCLTDSCDNLTVQHEERLCALCNCPNDKSGKAERSNEYHFEDHDGDGIPNAEDPDYVPLEGDDVKTGNEQDTRAGRIADDVDDFDDENEGYVEDDVPSAGENQANDYDDDDDGYRQQNEPCDEHPDGVDGIEDEGNQFDDEAGDDWNGRNHNGGCADADHDADHDGDGIVDEQQVKPCDGVEEHAEQQADEEDHDKPADGQNDDVDNCGQDNDDVTIEKQDNTEEQYHNDNDKNNQEEDGAGDEPTEEPGGNDQHDSRADEPSIDSDYDRARSQDRFDGTDIDEDLDTADEADNEDNMRDEYDEGEEGEDGEYDEGEEDNNEEDDKEEDEKEEKRKRLRKERRKARKKKRRRRKQRKSSSSSTDDSDTDKQIQNTDNRSLESIQKQSDAAGILDSTAAEAAVDAAADADEFFSESDTTETTDSSTPSYINDLLYSDSESNITSCYSRSASFMSQDSLISNDDTGELRSLYTSCSKLSEHVPNSINEDSSQYCELPSDCAVPESGQQPEQELEHDLEHDLVATSQAQHTYPAELLASNPEALRQCSKPEASRQCSSAYTASSSEAPRQSSNENNADCNTVTNPAYTELISAHTEDGEKHTVDLPIETTKS